MELGPRELEGSEQEPLGTKEPFGTRPVISRSFQVHFGVIPESFQGYSRVIPVLFGAGSASAQTIQRRHAAPDAPVADSGPFFHLKNPLSKRY